MKAISKEENFTKFEILKDKFNLQSQYHQNQYIFTNLFANLTVLSSYIFKYLFHPSHINFPK